MKKILVLIAFALTGCTLQNLGGTLNHGSGNFGSNVTGITASVQILDQNGFPVDGATVTGQWSGVVTSISQSAPTNTLGFATFLAPSTEKGRYTFTVTNVSKSGITYDSAQNVVNSGSGQN